MSSYLNWMSSPWRSTTSHPSPSTSSETHPLTSCQLIQSYHPFYNDDFTTPSCDSYVVLKPMERSSGTLQLNQAILRTSLLLADYSHSRDDVNESEWIENNLCLLLFCLDS